MKWLAFALFAATIPAANWMIGHVGTVCVPDGPCLVPVAPGLMAPSGVLLIGAALVLRDALREMGGLPLVAAAIAVGAALSGLTAAPGLVLASVVSFVLAEAADAAVYEPLRARGRGRAVLVSGAVAAVVDSALFLWLAFGSLDHMDGQVVGKLYASVAAALWLGWRARRPE